MKVSSIELLDIYSNLRLIIMYKAKFNKLITIIDKEIDANAKLKELFEMWAMESEIE